MSFAFVDRYHLDLLQVFVGPLCLCLFFVLNLIPLNTTKQFEGIFNISSFIFGIIFSAVVMGIIHFQFLQYRFDISYYPFVITGVLWGLGFFLWQFTNTKISTLFFLNSKALMALITFFAILFLGQLV